MRIDFFVHGVPAGAKQWKTEDSNYFQSFYDNCSDKLKFHIEMRKSNGVAYCYYNYLVYGNVVANDGRPGSYLGLSLRIDGFCKDFMLMYRVLDYLHNTYIVNNILQKNGSTLKYAISDFSSAENLCHQLEEYAKQTINNVCNSDNIIPLNGFQFGTGRCVQYNLYDCNENDVLQAVQQNGNVAMSPYYPTAKEKTIQEQCNQQIRTTQEHSRQQIQTIQQQCNQQLKDVKERCNQEIEKTRASYAEEINSLRTSLSVEKTKTQQFQSTQTQKDTKIKQLENENKRLESDKKRLEEQLEKIDVKEYMKKLTNSIQQPIINSINSAINYVLQNLQSQNSTQNEGAYNGDNPLSLKWELKRSEGRLKKALSNPVNFILLLLIFIILLLSVSSAQKADASYQNIINKMDALEYKVSDYMNNSYNKVDNNINNGSNCWGKGMAPYDKYWDLSPYWNYVP